ncbi:MAG: cell envelope biogenesis protein TonB [Saprospiraceae bacterium]|nr:MAG: cell envelope biogenesis protein TonB [Saprospiraceae bacterium]
MLNYLLESSLCWLVFYLVYILVLSRETFFQLNRWYLLATLLLGAFLPLIELPDFMHLNQPQPSFVNWLAPIQVPDNVVNTVAAPQDQTFSLTFILGYIYILGLILTSVRFLYGLWQLYTLYDNAEKKRARDYTLVITNKRHLPFSFFRYLFKSQLVETDTEDQYQITKHELAHIHGWHSLDVLLMELASILMWCNPLIYLYRRSLRVVHEYIADATVLRTTNRKHYGQMLIRQSQSGLQIAIVNHLIHSQLKKRIFMMTKNRSTYNARYKYLILAPILLLMLAIFASNSESAVALSPSETNNLEATNLTPAISDLSMISSAGGDVELPRFPGCEAETNPETRQNCSTKRLLEYVYTNVKYPKAAKDANIQGIAVVQFQVDVDGSIVEPTIVRSLGGGCDEEVLRVVNLMPKWIPGKKDGKVAKVEMNLPVKFKIDESEPAKAESKGEIFKVVEEMPRFPGCDENLDLFEGKKCADKKLLEYIMNNVKYPKEAKDAGFEGTSIVSFVIDKMGKITESEIVRSIHPSIDKEVLRIVNSMPDWIPGKQRGKVVDVVFKFPIKFKLDEEESKIPEELVPNLAPSPSSATLQLENFKVSPNPTEGIFKLTFSAAPKPITVIVSNEVGKEIFRSVKKDFNGNYDEQFDLSSSAKGTLIISVSQGDKYFTSKLVLQ